MLKKSVPEISSGLYEIVFQKSFQSYVKLILMVADTIK